MDELKIVSKRCGVINPLSIDDYLAHEGYQALERALSLTPEAIVAEVKKAYLRGRGGAGFPTATKMAALAAEPDPEKYVVVNADEGEPGNFKDRYLMENDPHSILEGMAIVAYATGAKKGYIYVRGEYDLPIKTLRWSVEQALARGYLGRMVMGAGFDFTVEVRSGAGSYVCGEEFALIESIEGKPGRTRVKPPFPTQKGIFGHPTLISNVETFANVPAILAMGGAAFAKIGTPSSTGTKLICLSGNVKRRGVFEIPFGVSIRSVIDELGGGVEGGRKIRMVQLGGACGPIIPPLMLDMRIDYERFEEFESKTGAGAIIVIDDRFDLFRILLRIITFFAHESCGKCVPCREGNAQLMVMLEKFIDRRATTADLVSLESLARVMHQTSLCGLGQTCPTSIIAALRYFREDFLERIEYPGI
ncbi:MAG: NADH-ubiquinone oxidoreductase-F iron-sulfur binding region domain-containing protein [Candidatus Izemoplasmatales bacterium]